MQVGDKVKIIGKHDEEKLYWNPQMDRTIGTIGTITSIVEHSGRITVDKNWDYLPDAYIVLSKVEELEIF